MNTIAQIEDAPPAPSSTVLTESLGLFTDRALTVSEKDAIAYHLANSRSKNTRSAYETQWRQFVEWCGAQQDDTGHGFVPFPCAVPTLILYISHLAAQGHKVGKIEQSVSAIRAVHSDNCNLLPGTSDISFTHPHIKSALSSFRRTLAQQGETVVKKPRHFDQLEINAMSLACAVEGTAQSVADRAMLLLLVNAGLRSSEVVALRTTDLEIDGDRGVNIKIRNSKTDQFGRGEQIYVAALAPHLVSFDFTKALKEWLKWRETYPVADESLFLGFRKGGNVAHLNADGVAHGITREAVTTCLLRCASRAGLETAGLQTISSHSGRHTMISIGFERGLDSVQISKTSRHKSLKSLLTYDQSSHKKASVSVRLWQ
ncbi:tyrosine-type recombinase/integrase [Arthrobacter sp. SO3]|uniref:tyrosine-type recombinase/integrase n=1 Tax=Arthrobacter sp. SO3 TaxID=1897057 RepID=UPI001D000D43|nr:tyrosine-type recombinase/integrase [Arthrobacter sp. SO3]MCB5291640.1 Tyrosine recombinase XerH [Arthrobacter sp. SO3]